MKKNINGNNIKDYMYVFVLKQKKNEVEHILKYSENRRKSTKIVFFF